MKQCTKCGNINNDGDNFCTSCGQPLNTVNQQQTNSQPHNDNQSFTQNSGTYNGYTKYSDHYSNQQANYNQYNYQQYNYQNPNQQGFYQPKSAILAGLLGIFFGFLGIHNFYLGYTSKGFIQLMLTLIGFCSWIFLIGIFMSLAAFIWGFVEGILLLTGSINVDGFGNYLK